MLYNPEIRLDKSEHDAFGWESVAVLSKLAIKRGWTAGLAAQTKPGDQLAVAILIFGLEIVQEFAAFVDHPQ